MTIKTSLSAKNIFLFSIGDAIEMYDFVLYVLFSGYIAQAFFPSKTHLTSLLMTLSVFAIGYLVRPIGGLIYAHFGDRFGRRTTLLVSMYLMGIPTFLMGLLPTYQQIGSIAPLILTLLRLLQGLAVGGDFPGMITFVSESVPDSKRGFLSSWIFSGINFGILLASLIAFIFSFCFSQAEMQHWGWRIPFLLGIILTLLGLHLRKKIDETPKFKAMQLKVAQLSKIPLADLFHKHLASAIKALLITSLGASIISLIFLMMPVYLTKFSHHNIPHVMLINSASVLIFSALIPIAGKLADVYSSQKIMLIAAILLVLLSYPAYYLLIHQDIDVTWPILLVFDILSAGILGPISLQLSLMFPTEIRYNGVAFGYSVGFALFGGLAPVISTALIEKTQLHSAPSFYLIFTGILTIIGLIWGGRQRNLCE